MISAPFLLHVKGEQRSQVNQKLIHLIATMSRQVSSQLAVSIDVLPANIHRQALASHYTRILRRWPVDRLRPEERTFQHLLQNRIKNPPVDAASGEQEANAAYLLLENDLRNRFPLSKKIMRPASNPEHYERVAREVDEIPTRGMLDRVWKRLSGMVRMQ